MYLRHRALQVSNEGVEDQLIVMLLAFWRYLGNVTSCSVIEIARLYLDN